MATSTFLSTVYHGPGGTFIIRRTMADGAYQYHLVSLEPAGSLRACSTPVPDLRALRRIAERSAAGLEVR